MQNPYEHDVESPVCPSHRCDCPGCSVRCAGCGGWVGEWTGESVRTVASRAYCVDCAGDAAHALADAVVLLMRADVEVARHAALHLAAPTRRRRWPTAVAEVA